MIIEMDKMYGEGAAAGDVRERSERKNQLKGRQSSYCQVCREFILRTKVRYGGKMPFLAAKCSIINPSVTK